MTSPHQGQNPAPAPPAVAPGRDVITRGRVSDLLRGAGMKRNATALAVLVTLVGTLVLANWLVTRFGLVQAVPFPFLLVPAGTYAAGLPLGLRDTLHDMAPRPIPWVLAAIGAGAAVSYLLGDGRIAIASAAAFLLAELLDLAVYAPVRHRYGWGPALFCSNAAGAVADTLLFLRLSGLGLSWAAVTRPALGQARTAQRGCPADLSAGASHARSRGERVKFYLGTHETSWLWKATPRLFLSRRRLVLRCVANLVPSIGRWALDSGGFTELKMYGRWTLTARQYVNTIRPYVERIGGCDFIAAQDWMCEPEMLAMTGYSIREHQKLTVENFLELRELAPDLPIAPAIQGYHDPDTYLACVALYQDAGVDLRAEPVVGVGSVCRLQHTDTIERVFSELAPLGLSLHGYGVKTLGLLRYGQHLASADSLAWSFDARRAERLPGCVGHKNCANCLSYALAWHTNILNRLRAQGQVAA